MADQNILTKQKIKEIISKINQSLKKNEPPKEEEIEILKKLFIKYKKPSFLLGLLSFYEKCKKKELLFFVKENLAFFKNDFSQKTNQLFVVYKNLANEECEMERMNLEKSFLLKYKMHFPDWFDLKYFKEEIFNPILETRNSFLDPKLNSPFDFVNARRVYECKIKDDFLESSFLECYTLVSKKEYKEAMNKLNLFLRKMKLVPKNVPLYLHSYCLIAFCLFYGGLFIEAITYLEMAGKLIQSDYFDKVINFIKYGKPGMDIFLSEVGFFYSELKKTPELLLSKENSFFFDESLIKNKRLLFNILIHDHPILRDLIYEENSFLIQRLKKQQVRKKDLLSLFSDLFEKRNVLSIQKRDSFLELILYPSLETKKIEITFSLEEILQKSKKTFKMKIKKVSDKMKFDLERKNLDEKIKKKVEELDFLLFEAQIDFLLVGEFEFPFERCTKLSKSRRIFRLSGAPSRTESSIFYVLDPQNKLPKTQERLLPLLSPHAGISQRPATQSDIKSDPITLLYFGHGTGSKFLNFTCKTESVYLFGCSSAKRFFFFGANPHGAVYKYKCNMFVGCLWDVSDKDVDLVGECFLRTGKIDFMSAKYFYLGGSAVVVYELP